jgi:hypothetical protein
MSDNGSNPRGIPRWKFVVGASGFCALISVTLSSLFWLVYFRPHSLVLAVQMFGGFWLTAFIPAGFFGCAAGLVGGAWFSTRRGRIRSTTLLLAEAATVGIAFGLVVPPLESLLEPRDSRPTPVPPEFWFCSLVVGCTTAILFGIFFRRAILAAPQMPQSDS